MQWRVDVQGPTWQVILDEETLKGRTLFNGKALVQTIPSSDQAWFDSGRAFLQQAYGILGVDGGAALTNTRVLTLPLGMSGGTDKVSVRFSQVVQGVPVRGGYVSALFDTAGNLLCLDSDGLPEVSSFNVQPTVSSATAHSVASAAFLADTGGPALFVSEPVLVIRQRLQGSQRSGVLVWEVELDDDDQAYNYHVNATGSATVLDRDSLTHECFQQGSGAMQGSVSGDVTAGLAPPASGVPDWSFDRAANLVPSTLPHLYIRRLANNALLGTTKPDGTFKFPAPNQIVNVALFFQGPYVDVCSLSGSGLRQPPCNDPAARLPVDYERLDLSCSISSPNNLFLSPPARDPLVVAQANVFLRVNQMREWIREINPLDLTFDLNAPYLARPNRIGPGSNDCRAAFTRVDGRRIIFFSRVFDDLTHTCGYNSAFPVVIWHEMGHWMNELYGRGNDKASGFGEGVADVWAAYQADYPRLGLSDNPNNPEFLPRFGDDRNTFCFCGDCPPAGVDHSASECIDIFSNTDDHRDDATGLPVGCTNGTQGCHHGSEHGNGIPLLGALWKVRENLKAVHGPDLGSAVANALFLGWMAGFTTPRIKNVIAYQFAILDGDGIISQAPNLASINAGFQARSFPGVLLPPVRVTCP